MKGLRFVFDTIIFTALIELGFVLFLVIAEDCVIDAANDACNLASIGESTLGWLGLLNLFTYGLFTIVIFVVVLLILIGTRRLKNDL